MTEIIGKVKSISEKTGKKADGKDYTLYNIVLESEGKEVKLNTFDSADHATFKQAFDTGQFITVETEKNEKGFTVIKKLSLLADAIPKESTLVKEAVKLGAVVVDEGDKRDRSMAISYSKDLAAAGKIEVKDIIIYANKFLKYILNQKD